MARKMKKIMMSKIYPLCALLAAVAFLSGCEETKRALGQTKEGPDEFAVYQRAPLSLPPEYGLKPPNPGADRPQAVTQETVPFKPLAEQAGRLAVKLAAPTTPPALAQANALSYN